LCANKLPPPSDHRFFVASRHLPAHPKSPPWNPLLTPSVPAFLSPSLSMIPQTNKLPSSLTSPPLPRLPSLSWLKTPRASHCPTAAHRLPPTSHYPTPPPVHPHLQPVPSPMRVPTIPVFVLSCRLDVVSLSSIAPVVSVPPLSTSRTAPTPHCSIYSTNRPPSKFHARGCQRRLPNNKTQKRPLPSILWASTQNDQQLPP
jgi:hypothetical protein